MNKYETPQTPTIWDTLYLLILGRILQFALVCHKYY